MTSPQTITELARPAKRELRVLMASPRGFCAGVQRAIDIVEAMIARFGAPIYVRHEIVHNRAVVDRLQAMGAVFVEDLHDAPQDRPIVFSAHGVPKTVPDEAARRNMHYVDATCPLVSKVHREAERFHARGYQLVLIGHRFHPEVEGTIGQVPEGTITLVETEDDVERLKLDPKRPIACLTQTTLSVDETAGLLTKLRERFDKIIMPDKDDICYATTNRQQAVKRIAGACDVFLVVGSPNSSNSCRLVDVALKAGAGQAYLIENRAAFDLALLDQASTIGISAGASAPESLVEEVLDLLQDCYDVTLDSPAGAREDIVFRMPPLGCSKARNHRAKPARE